MAREWILVVALGAAATVPASAGFSAMDSDGNGRLSPEELADAGLFQRWDKDADGQLVPTEFEGAPRLLADWDIDGDSRLSEIEFQRGLYRYGDADDSQDITEPEYQAELAEWFSVVATR